MQGDNAGYAVALHGDTAAVGATNAEPTPNIPTGAVQVFRLVGGIWLTEAVLQAGDASAGFGFGASIALDQDLMVVSATGFVNGNRVAYTFSRSGSTWQQVDELMLPQSSGATVALSGDTLVVGGGRVFVRSGSGWVLQAQLQGDAGETLGAVAVDGDLVAVGSSSNASFPNIPQEYMYFFSRSGGNWVRESKVDLGHGGGLVAISGQTAIVSAEVGVEAFLRDQGIWVAQGMLDPSGAPSGFGSSLALQGDRAIVGSPTDDLFGFVGLGTAYVFERTAGSWSRVAHLTDENPWYSFYYFGASVALSGDMFLTGVPSGSTPAGLAGKATVFSLQASSWQPTATLDLGNAHGFEGFGSGVALAGTELLVGAKSARTLNPAVLGAAYIYAYSQGGWTEEARLQPSLANPSQLFGQATALNGDTAALGAAGDDTAGAVYVFERGNGSWPLQARLAGGVADGNVWLGWSVALAGDLLAAGEPAQVRGGTSTLPGLVRVFQRTGAVWSPQAVVQAADAAHGDEFGFSVALDGNTLVAGAPRVDSGIEQDAGAVYVYVGSGSIWAQQAKITAPIPGTNSGFGLSVALSGDLLVVGAGNEDPVVSTRGRAYIYERVGTTWSLRQELIVPAPVPGSFGRSVSLSAMSGLALASAPRGGAAGHGLVYVFARSGTAWTLSSTLQAPSSDAPVTPYEFGTAVSLDGENAVIGAPAFGPSGTAFLAPVGDHVFVDGFESSP